MGNLAQAVGHTEPGDLGTCAWDRPPLAGASITNNANGTCRRLERFDQHRDAGLIATGLFTSLAPQATNNTSLEVSMDTASAGSRNGTATITQVSDGSFNSGRRPRLAPRP